MSRGKDLVKRKTRSDKQAPNDRVRCPDCSRFFFRIKLSKAGLCPECSARRVTEAATQMREKRGYYYEKWLAQVSAIKAVRELRGIMKKEVN